MAVRTFRAALVVVLGLVTLVVLPTASSPAGATSPIDLSMVTGEIDLRAAEEPAELATPTTITGEQDESGVITDGSLATPGFSFEIPMTVPITTTAFVDAALTEVDPAMATGSVDEALLVTLGLELSLDMHIDVGGFLEGDCRAAPIVIGLSGVYDPQTQRVTLVDDSFVIPPMVDEESCEGFLADLVNDLLAGSGHSIELVMEGVIAAPDSEDETTTSLEVSPTEVREGDEVTLTAEVAPVVAATPLPTGFVEFRAGAGVIGSAAIDAGGVATFLTSELPAGVHQLSAHYQGDLQHAPSSSAAVETWVAPEEPVAEVTVAMSTTVPMGASPRPATVTIVNPAEGAAIDNAHVRFTLARTGPGFASLDADQVVVEWLDGSTWEPIALTEPADRVVAGSVGPSTGFALPADSTEVVRLRISAPTRANPATAACQSTETACPGPVDLTVTLDEVDPGTGAMVGPALGRDLHPLFLVEPTRRATTISLLGGHPMPHTVRQGYSIDVVASIAPAVAGYAATGEAGLLIDGQPVLARTHGTPLSESSTERLPVEAGYILGQTLLPPDIDPGEHVLTVRYYGNPVFGPAETSSTFTVLAADAHPFVCQAPGASTGSQLGAGIVFDADVPAAAAVGAPVELDVTAAEIHLGRPTIVDPIAATIDDDSTLPVDTGPPVNGIPQLTGISIGLSPDGAGTAESVTRSNGGILLGPYPADESAVDQVLTLDEPTAEIDVAGDPGDLVPVQVEAVGLDLVDADGLEVPIHCVPVGDALQVGEIEVAGTVISVTPNPASTTDEVTIDAETFPADAAGTVTFTSDIDGQLGTEPSTAGRASIVTDDLSPGTHHITVSFDATDPEVPDTQSDPVTLVVVP